MKKLFLLGLAVTLFSACQNEPKRYFSESAEIDSFKTSITEYGNGDWDAWRSHFADTAKLYVNSTKPITVADLENAQKQLLLNFSSYGFLDKDSFIEMVLDSDDETWVNYWATWQGKLKANDQVIDVPVHITSQFINGKVVKLFDYWDSAPITAALEEIEAANNMPADEKATMAQIDSFVNEFLNKKDSSVLSNILSDDYVRYMNGVKVASNAEELQTSMDVFFTGFPDFNISNPHRTIKGDNVFVHWFMTGTNTGEFSGFAATGKKVKIEGLSRLHFNNEGKMDVENIYFDQLNLMQQLGKTLN